MVNNATLTQILVKLHILTNLGLEARKGEIFRNTKVMDKVIKCFSETVPPRIELEVASREPNFI